MTEDTSAETPRPGAEVKEDQRRHPRSKILRRGMIIFNEGWSNLSCNIMDVSEGGAWLRMLDLSIHCPNEFQLRSEITNQTRLCTVVWRRGRDLGVRWITDIGDI